MARKELFEYDMTIYPLLFWVGVGFTEEDLSDNFIDAQGNPLQAETAGTNQGGYEARTTDGVIYDAETGKGGILVFFSNKANMKADIAAHEASHAAKAVFDSLGMGEYHDECFEYLLSWMVRCILDAKKPHGSNK